MCPSSRLIFLWASLSYLGAFAFVIKAPTPINAFERFNWTRHAEEPLNIGIWLAKDPETCPSLDPRHMQPVVLQIGLVDVYLDPESQNYTGRELLWMFNNYTGNATLCAYNYSLGPTELDSYFSEMQLLTSEKIIITNSTTPASGGQSPTTANCSSSNPRLFIGEIIGIAVGSVAFFALLAGLYLLYRRRCRQKAVNNFHKERKVLAQAPLASMRAASPIVREIAIPKKHMERTSTDQPFLTLSGEKTKLDVEDGLVVQGLAL